jgi:predicted transcriptional regulator
MAKAKSSRKLERHFKGVSNHRRIDMLLLIKRRPGITLDGLMKELNGNQKTFSEHARRLMLAGLVEKSYMGRSVEHRLTPYGELFANFIIKFANRSET